MLVESVLAWRAASVRTWQVFPFDFSGSSIPWTGITRALIIIAIFGSVVALVSELVKLAGGQASAGSGSRSLPRT